MGGGWWKVRRRRESGDRAEVERATTRLARMGLDSILSLMKKSVSEKVLQGCKLASSKARLRACHSEREAGEVVESERSRGSLDR